MAKNDNEGVIINGLTIDNIRLPEDERPESEEEK